MGTKIDFSGFDFIKLFDKLNYRRFSGATLSYEGNVLTLLDREGDIFESDSVGSWVSEGHILERYFSRYRMILSFLFIH